jgi:hypothetical protein
MEKWPSPLSVIGILLFVGVAIWGIAASPDPKPIEGPVSGLHYEPARGGPTGMRRLECYRVWVDTSDGQQTSCVPQAEFSELRLGQWYRLP